MGRHCVVIFYDMNHGKLIHRFLAVLPCLWEGSLYSCTPLNDVLYRSSHGKEWTLSVKIKSSHPVQSMIYDISRFSLFDEDDAVNILDSAVRRQMPHLISRILNR